MKLGNSFAAFKTCVIDSAAPSSKKFDMEYYKKTDKRIFMYNVSTAYIR